jgi:surface antigen
MSDCESYARPRVWTSLRAGAALGLLAVALGLCGCATSIPLPAFISPDDVTGSIRAPISPLSSALDAEDWRRAKSALAVALDPQGNGAPVSWDNPTSGAKGSFKPVALAYAQDGLICRAFEADIGGKVPARQVTGLGCRDKTGEWDVSQVRPLKAS